MSGMMMSNTSAEYVLAQQSSDHAEARRSVHSPSSSLIWSFLPLNTPRRSYRSSLSPR